MNVVWAATALETGWFSGLERHSNVQDLEAHIKALGTGLGQGYLEIRRPDGDLPYLALASKELLLSSTSSTTLAVCLFV
ncbi:hypothetical protein [Streptomyces sp. ITFR-16]|uniref:hypothetical protein n=1 Tax=Streptomyces sp. ITFR-16 TaxID=3075198 RepID=UPI00288C2716|nr:hypothetical protein [Streptomyces sp. ITFR-16]WNI20811.1 hypothetical protein RLT58_02265 [Streptomyces sp. ITFR-16]